MQANPSSLALNDGPPRLWRAIARRLKLRRRHRIAVEGYVFIAIMMLVGFAAWHSGTNLLYLMFAMMIAFFLMQGVLVSVCLKGLRVRRKMPPSACAMESLRIPFVVENRKRLLTSYAVRVVDHLANGDVLGTGYIVRLPARTSQEHEYWTCFPRRGLVMLDRMEVITRYPFGLVQRSFFVDCPAEIVVYPQVVEVQPALPSLQIDVGDHPTRRKGVGADLYGLKEYVEGGHARHIHWRSTAKTRKLMLREFEKEERRKVTLLLRNQLAGSKADGEAEEFEKAVVFTASLARLLIRYEYEVQLETDSGVVPYGTGVRHLDRMLRALAMIELASVSPHTCGAQEHSEDTLCIGWSGASPAPGSAFARVIDVRDWKIVSRGSSEGDRPKFAFVPRSENSRRAADRAGLSHET